MKLRLADSSLELEVAPREGPAWEALAPGPSLADGMGQGQGRLDEGAVECAILGGVLFDESGALEADLGLAGGAIAAIGQAGNPDVQPSVDIPIGPASQIVDARGLIVTPGAIDFLAEDVASAAALEDALAAGVSALHLAPAPDPLGPGPIEARIARWRRITDPPHLGLWAQGSSSRAAALEEQLVAGAAGLFVDDARGTTPSSLRAAARFAAPIAFRLDPWRPFGDLWTHAEALGDRPAIARVLESRPESRLEDALLASRFELAVDLRPPLLADNAAQRGLDARSAAAQSLVDAERALVCCGGAELWRDAFRAADALQRALGGDADARARRFLSAITARPARALGQGAGVLRVGAPADLALWRPERFAIRPERVILRGGWGPALRRAPEDGATLERPGPVDVAIRGGRLWLNGAAAPERPATSRAFAPPAG